MLRNSRVLVVEDDRSVGILIEAQLEQIGCVTVGKTGDGLTAIEMTRALRPDVVLMDVKLPGLSGIQAARRIGEECPTPVVLITGYETPELVEQASQAGVGGYLIKPINAKDLERVLMIAIARFEDLVELRRLNQDLEDRNEELDAFAYTVAHDIKNPLALVIGFAEALVRYRTSLSEDELVVYLGSIEKAGHQMSRIIDQLLMLARSRPGDMKVEPLDMAAAVDGALQRLVHTIREFQAEVIRPDSWPVAWGYGPLVEEVWVDYIDRAIKRSRKPPHIELGAATQVDGMVRFWVVDKAASPTQGDNQDGWGRGGVGLSAIQRIVERLGGEVGVEHKDGQPSSLFFTLPAADHGKGI